MRDKDEVQPIHSQPENDLFFTDPDYEMTGTQSGKGGKIKRTLRKKPWFSQRMNFTGRLIQICISVVIALLGFGVGMKFLHIPVTSESIKLLLTHGYRGPYEGLQVVDLELHPAYNPSTPVVAVEVTLHNFGQDFATGSPIRLTLTQKERPRHVHHEIACCDTPIRPHKSYSFQTIVENVSFGAETVHVSLLQE